MQRLDFRFDIVDLELQRFPVFFMARIFAKRDLRVPFRLASDDIRLDPVGRG